VSIAPVFLAKGPGVLSLKKIATKGFRQSENCRGPKHNCEYSHLFLLRRSSPSMLARARRRKEIVPISLLRTAPRRARGVLSLVAL
jgi:hypothetical protein